MLLLEDFLKIGFILLTVGVIAASCFKVKNSAIFLYSMIFIYLVLVLGITLCPIPYGDVEHIYPAVHNFVPFRTIVSALEGGITLTAMAQIGGNILISAPYGVYLKAKVKKWKGVSLFLLPLLFPVVVEGLQYLVGITVGVIYRSFDVDDFILNLFGVYLGILCGKMFFILWRNNSVRRIKNHEIK